MTARESLSARIYARLLRSYPAAFRDRHGEEMVRIFRQGTADARERGHLAVARFWTGAAIDALRTGIAERRHAGGRTRVGGAAGGAGPGDDRMGGGMDSFVKDARYALRTLVKNPGFTAIAVLTIGLGIGVNTAIFSVVQAVLLDPLPYEDPEELVLVWGEMRNRGVTHFPSSPPDFHDVRQQADLLEDVAAVSTFALSLTGDGEPVQVLTGTVTTSFFDLLGVEPALGRGFVDEDGTPNEPGVQPGTPGSLPSMAILSHGLWQRRWGGDPGVIGRTVEVSGGSTEIVGVMPPDFQLLLPPTSGMDTDVDIWLAARFDYANAPRNNVFLQPIGRLADGVAVEQAQAQVDRIAASIAAIDQVKTTAGFGVRLEPFRADLTAHVRPTLLALLGAVGFVLLIACANVSNLLLVRASGRSRELAVRAAMGGSRGRLIRQMLIESGVLALGGGLLGIGLAAGGIRLLLALQPGDLPRIGAVGFDATVLAFTALAAGGAALLFGLLPALQASRVELADALKERGQTSSNVSQKLVRNGVVVGEVALSLVLLIGAGLMVRSFIELASVSPGYEPEGVLTFTASPPFGRYTTAGQRSDFHGELRRRVEALPGVTRASTVFPLPLGGVPFNGRFGPEEALTDPEAFGQAAYRSVQAGYFEAMGTELLAGRTFTDADAADSVGVVVIDELLAERLWPGRSAIGERFLIRLVTPEPEFVEVIGVVEHQRSETLAADGMPAVYFTDRFAGAFASSYVVRTEVDPLSLVSAIRQELAQVDPMVPLADVRPMEGYVGEAMASTRFALTLIGVFGAIALALASIGLYGVLSYVVRQRTAEIGVRMAFGAEASSIQRLVVGHGLGLAAAGVGVGLLVAFPLTGVMESLLVGVTPTDPLTFGSISTFFVLVAALACWVPARRATHVDPVRALREE